MPVVSTTRKHLSELVKGVSAIQATQGVNYNYVTVDVEDSGESSVDNIGTLLMWSASDSAFIPFAVNPDWAASTAYSVGDVVKPATQNGLEFVCIVAGTSNDVEGEEFINIEGAITTETDGVQWLARRAYTHDIDSPLPNKAKLVLTVGAKEGIGFNKEDTDLSATAVKMTALFRGEAGVVEEEIEGFSDLAADDQAEVRAALEAHGIAVESAAEEVTPSYVV